MSEITYLVSKVRNRWRIHDEREFRGTSGGATGELSERQGGSMESVGGRTDNPGDQSDQSTLILDHTQPKAPTHEYDYLHQMGVCLHGAHLALGAVALRGICRVAVPEGPIVVGERWQAGNE